MERFKEILRKLLFPGIAVVLISVPAAAAALTYVFLYAEEYSPRIPDLRGRHVRFLQRHFGGKGCGKIPKIQQPHPVRLQGNQIEFEADMEDWTYIEGDEELLALVWTNLISNAIKFTPSGGKVTLGQTSDGDSVTVTVADTGFGMAPETVKHIFDKFYQGDTSHSTEGNGLGLALVRRILELSDGTITVKSTPGQGSAFTVRLPVAPLGEETLH